MEIYKTHRMRTQKRSLLLATAKGQSKVLIESHRSAVLSCDFHESGKFLASSNSAGEIHICPTNSGTEKLAYLKSHRDPITQLHYSSDGLDLYSSSKDRTISIWDAFRGVRKSIIVGHSRAVNTVQCFQSSSPIIFSGSSDKTVRVWDVRQKDCAAMFKSQHEVATVTFGKWFLYSGGLNNGDITAWDIRQNRIVHVLAGHTDSVTGLAPSPCEKYLASCSADGTLRKWDVYWLAEIGTEIQSFPLDQDQGDQSHLRRCAWSPDAKLLSAGSGSKVVVFDANSGERLHEYDGHSEEITAVTFHPRQKMICSAGADKKLIMHYM